MMNRIAWCKTQNFSSEYFPVRFRFHRSTAISSNTIRSGVTIANSPIRSGAPQLLFSRLGKRRRSPNSVKKKAGKQSSK